MRRDDLRATTLLFASVLFLSGCADSARHGIDRLMSVMGQATMSGRVTNSSGTGINSATVAIIDAATATTVGSATTNSNGDYSVTVPDGTYTVRVTGGGFGETTLLNVSIVGLKTQNFILISGNVGLSGRLLGPTGAGIGNATVRLTATSTLQTTTAADGSFSFAVPTGTYTIEFYSPGGLQPPLPTSFYFYVSNFVLNGDRVQDFTVPARTATFVVTDPNGTPVSNVALSVGCQYSVEFNPVPNMPANGYMCSSGRSTNAQGIVTTGFLPMANAIGFVFTPQLSSGLGVKQVSIRPLSNDSSFTITLDPPQYSTLTDQNGNGYPNSTVYAYNMDWQLVAQASTLADGRFALQVPNGNYRLYIANNDGTRSISIYLHGYPVTTGNVPNLVIPKITFTVNVRTPENEPINGRISGGCFNPGFDIPAPAGVTIDGNFCPNSPAGPDGKVKLNLPPTKAATTVSVLPPANSTYGSTTVTLPISSSDYETTVTLPAGISWQGTARNSGGTAVPGLNLQQYAASFASHLKTVTTGAAGTFDLITTPGTYAFLLSGSGNTSGAAPYNYSLQTTSNFAISGPLTQDLTLPTIYLTVTVLDAAGHGVQNVVIGEVWASGVSFTATTGFTVSGNMYPRAVTDANGVAKVAMFAANQAFDLPIKPPAGSRLAPTTVRIQPMTGDASLAVVAPPLNTTPVARMATIASASEPATITLDASTSTDDDNDPLTYQWSFPDGTTLNGMVVTREYNDNAEHDVTLTVNDGKGGLATARSHVSVVNVNPTATLDVPATDPKAGEAFTIALSGGSDASPVDAADLQYAFDCGDGYGPFSPSASQQCTRPDAGTVTVKATVQDKDGGSNEYTATVNVVQRQAAQTITFAEIAGQTYGAAPIMLGATASSNLPVSYAISGSCTLEDGQAVITGAGSCSVTASQEGNADWLAAEPVTRSFDIAKATATLSLSSSALTYDGEPHGLTASTQPAGIDGVSVSYNGSAALPVNAGTYEVIATLDNANYQAEPVTAQLVIDKAVITATAANQSMVYADAVPELTSSFTGFVNGDDASVIGGAYQLTTTATSSSPAGTYTITPVISGLTAANYTFTAVNGVLTVSKRGAATAYTGDSYALTAGTKITSATVRLAATVSRTSGSAGNLTLARVNFLLFADNNTSSTPNLRYDNVAVSSTGDVLLQQSVPAGTWTVRVEIAPANGYWATASSTDGVLTIAVPASDRGITGGGWIDQALSTVGRTHFGFTVAAGKKGNMKGNATFTFRDTDGYAYRIKTTSMLGATFLINNVKGRASFESRANVQQIDPATGEIISSRGNQRIMVDVLDGGTGKNATADRMAIVIQDANGVTWKQFGSYSALGALGGGSVDVKSK